MSGSPVRIGETTVQGMMGNEITASTAGASRATFMASRKSPEGPTSRGFPRFIQAGALSRMRARLGSESSARTSPSRASWSAAITPRDPEAVTTTVLLPAGKGFNAKTFAASSSSIGSRAIQMPAWCRAALSRTPNPAKEPVWLFVARRPASV